MSEPGISIGVALAGGTAATLVVDQVSLMLWGIPVSTVTAAATGALVPMLLLEPEPLARAIRIWLGSLLLSLLCTAAVLRGLALDKQYAVLVAGTLAAFGRDVYCIARGELPPIITWLRERLTGRRHP